MEGHRSRASMGAWGVVAVDVKTGRSTAFRAIPSENDLACARLPTPEGVGRTTTYPYFGAARIASRAAGRLPSVPTFGVGSSRIHLKTYPSSIRITLPFENVLRCASSPKIQP